MEKLEASFSMLIMSIASSATIALGLAPFPSTREMFPDKNIARFNIDLLIMLQQKTKNNLESDEKTFLDSVIQDLQLKFVQMK